MDSSDEYHPVLRVAQLDTGELNGQLLMHLKQSINEDHFKYIQAGFLQKYHPEIFAFLKFVLWYNTYYKTGQTVGQFLLDWSYGASTGRWMLVKKLAHGLIYCLDEWLEHRLFSILAHAYKLLNDLRKRFTAGPMTENDESSRHEQALRRIQTFCNYFSILLEAASFLNFIVFLYQGKYLHVWERLLRMRPSYNKQQMMREVNTDIVAREELWQSYFALFKFSNSVLNVKELFQKAMKRIGPSKSKSTAGSRYDPVKLTVCAICSSQPPTNVHCSSDYESHSDDSCQHLFCYYCIKTELSKSAEFECPKCFRLIKDVKMYLNNENLY